MKKRILAVVLMLCLLVGLVACGNNNTKNNPTGTPAGSGSQTPDSSTSGDKTPDATPAKVTDGNYGGLTKLPNADNPVTFKFFIRDQKTAASKDNPVLKKITELTGVTIEMEYLVGDLDQKMGVMIAGEDYPDAIFVGGDSPKFIDAGAFIPMEDYIQQYANLKALYGVPSYVPKMTAADGHIYILELFSTRNNPGPVYNQGGAAFWMQKAVLADAGYVVPKTVDEYFNIIENYKAKYPTIDGVPTSGFEICCDYNRDFCLRNPPQHLMGQGNEGDVYVDKATGVASYYQVTESAKNWFKKLNEEYHKGIIDQDTFSNNFDQYIAKVSSGRVLAMFDQAWSYGDATNALKSANKWERTYVALPITDPGIRDSYLDPNDSSTFTGNNGLGITKNCKNVDRLLEFFDWVLQKEVQDYLQWGVEGVDYELVDGGKSKILTAERRAINNDVAQKRDLTGDPLWQYCPKRQGTYEDGQPCGPGESKDEYLFGMNDYDKEFLGKYGFKCDADFLSEPEARGAWYPCWSISIPEGSAASEAVKTRENLNRLYYPQLITCDASQYDATWDAFMAEWNSSDLQPYLDVINSAIKDILAK